MAESSPGLIEWKEPTSRKTELTLEAMFEVTSGNKELAGDTVSAITAHEEFPSSTAALVGDSTCNQSAAILLNEHIPALGGPDITKVERV